MCNVVFNRYVNKANITTSMYAGSLCVVLGTLIAILWGPRNVYEFNLGHLKVRAPRGRGAQEGGGEDEGTRRRGGRGVS